MKKLSIIICICYVFIGISCNAQSKESILRLNEMKSQIKSEEFFKFLENFPQKKFPFISKKEMSIDDKILYRIPKEYVLKFLSIKESNMYYETFDYDYDEDIKSNIRKELTDYFPINLILTKNYIMLVYGNINNWEEYPNTYNHLITFDYNNHIIDSLTVRNVNSNFGFEWEEYVLINPDHFKLFKYDLNWKNATKRGEIIDENEYKNVCVIEYYSVDENGRMKKIKSEKKYLKEDGYRWYDPKIYPDDPMNLR